MLRGERRGAASLKSTLVYSHVCVQCAASPADCSEGSVRFVLLAM